MQDNQGKEIAVLYRQYDGYPDGHGNDLKELLGPITIVNGIRGGQKHIANGAECLAAQIVAHFKEDVGGFYLYPAGTRDCGEEYVYTVYPSGELVNMRVQVGSVTFFGLPGTKQSNMPVLYDGAAKDFDVEKAEAIHLEVRKEIPNDYIESKKEP